MNDFQRVPWRTSGLNGQDAHRKISCCTKWPWKVLCGGQDGCDGGGGWPVGLNWFWNSPCLGNRLLKGT